MNKYIIDIEALKNCIKLLPKPVKQGDNVLVNLDDVIEMIDNFPKDPNVTMTPVNYHGPVISTSPAVVPDTLKGWEVMD